MTSDELRKLFLFESFSDQQLSWLADSSTGVHFEAHEQVFAEGQPATGLWVLVEGEWRISRLIGGFDSPVNTTARPGTWGGGLPLVGGTYQISGVATSPSTFLHIPDAGVEYMLAHGFPIATHLLAGITTGARRSEALRSQHEKLAALSQLAGGLTHELNNPAAAARSAAASLRRVQRDRQEGLLDLLEGPETAATWRGRLAALTTSLESRAASTQAAPLAALERSDREGALIAWLEGRGTLAAYDVAPPLVDVGADVPWLELAAAGIPESSLPALLRWLVATAEGIALATQLEHSTARIAKLIGAIQTYSHMDQAPLGEIDLREGLESTLTLLEPRFGEGIALRRQYQPGLPPIPAHAGELNGVWTELIENALYAMGRSGTLSVRTAQEDGAVLVEIADTGVGIPAEALPRIFEPFFTTKGVGHSGVGLDLVYNVVVLQHLGSVQADSEPGRTAFRVRLPLRPGTGTTATERQADA